MSLWFKRHQSVSCMVFIVWQSMPRKIDNYQHRCELVRVDKQGLDVARGAATVAVIERHVAIHASGPAPWIAAAYGLAMTKLNLIATSP